jgi:hypothetical protein
MLVSDFERSGTKLGSDLSPWNAEGHATAKSIMRDPAARIIKVTWNAFQRSY